jgi:hypothetical protein
MYVNVHCPAFAPPSWITFGDITHQALLYFANIILYVSMPTICSNVYTIMYFNVEFKRVLLPHAPPCIHRPCDSICLPLRHMCLRFGPPPGLVASGYPTLLDFAAVSGIMLAAGSAQVCLIHTHACDAPMHVMHPPMHVVHASTHACDAPMHVMHPPMHVVHASTVLASV